MIFALATKAVILTFFSLNSETYCLWDTGVYTSLNICWFFILKTKMGISPPYLIWTCYGIFLGNLWDLEKSRKFPIKKSPNMTI